MLRKKLYLGRDANRPPMTKPPITSSTKAVIPVYNFFDETLSITAPAILKKNKNKIKVTEGASI